ncbi:MAG: SUF system NifU family Fe-S cluster assembly protein [Acidimicrobiales bacterium]
MPGLEDLYREIILDHYRNPRNRGELDTPPAHRTEGFNPLCGDEIVVYVSVGEGRRVSDIKIGGQGCSISQSSASMMSAAVKGKTLDEARAMTRAFKALMSIHETKLGGDANGDGSGTDAPSPDPEVKLGDLEALQGVVKFPVRIKCATLSWNTLTQALDEVASAS